MDIIRENREEYGCTGKIVEIKDTTLVIDASYLFNEDVREIAIDKIIRITEADKSHVSSLHERGVAYL